ncbi:MAG: hypothetical protein GY941_29015 [Planctomycetes bacterium]|nr:hypothetical protein [Planctomycetota bacterium]
MTPEYNVGHFVWSKKFGERVTIARISIDTNGITYEDLGGNHHKPTELSTEKSLITQKQFDKVWAGLGLWERSRPTKREVLKLVKECIKEVQE